MNNVHLINHILIDHKITILRDEKTKCKQFREVIEEIAMLETLEVLKDAPTKTVTVKTPLEMVGDNVCHKNRTKQHLVNIYIVYIKTDKKASPQKTKCKKAPTF